MRPPHPIAAHRIPSSRAPGASINSPLRHSRAEYTRLAVVKDNKPRLEAIEELLQPGEAVVFDVLALLFDPDGDLKKREVEGYLVLTDRRVIFSTTKHGNLVELPRDKIKVPVTVRDKFMMSHLELETSSGTSHSLVMKRAQASEIARNFNKTTPV